MTQSLKPFPLYKSLFFIVIFLFYSTLKGQVTTSYVKLVGYSNNGDAAWMQLCELEMNFSGVGQSLVLEAYSACSPGEGWDNSIDNDTTDWDATTTAKFTSQGVNEVWAIYSFSGGGAKSIDEIKIKTDCDILFNNRWMDGFRVEISDSDSSFTTILDTTLGSNGNWQRFALNPYLCPVDIGDDTSICEGSSMVLRADSSFASYLWQDSSTSASLTVYAGGTYWLKATKGACIAFDTIVIVENPLPNVDLGEGTIICVGVDTIRLDAGKGFTSYSWSNGDTTNAIDVINVGTYSVTVSNNACSNSDTITFSSDLCDGINNPLSFEPQFSVFPNPNDGSFDLRITNYDLRFAHAEVILYDVLGREVYRTKISDNNTSFSCNTTLKKGIYYLQLIMKPIPNPNKPIPNPSQREGRRLIIIN